jgi:hypothetical protein
MNQGIPTEQHYCKETLDNSEEPWINGININIDAESSLKRLDYYNPEDCINQKAYKKLMIQNRKSNIKMYKDYHKTLGAYPAETGKWFNNFTKMKISEPIDFDYGQHFEKCLTQKRK